jgi:cation transport protein ChaC
MTWVFGYGSLMWRPGFSYQERRQATLRGYSRAFCRLSFRHRGTPEAPGMVVGLAPGGSCHGIAYRVAEQERRAVLAYLDDREGAGYRRRRLPIAFGNGNGRRRESWVYLPEPGHPSYAPDLPEARIAELIATGVGESGAARDYLRELLQELGRLGVDDPRLRGILAKVERFRGNGKPRAAS